MCINKLSSQSHSDIEAKDIFGLKSLSSFLSSKLSHVNDILVLIDSRSVAVENLYILSDALSRNLQYYGNTVSSYTADLVNRVVQGDLNYINKHPFLLSLSKSPSWSKKYTFSVHVYCTVSGNVLSFTCVFRTRQIIYTFLINYYYLSALSATSFISEICFGTHTSIS